MTSLRDTAMRMGIRVGPSPWPGFEYVRGYSVFTLPTTTGDVLVLRVLPENDFAPYTTVWHCSPAGAWSMFIDAADPDVACPRYFGPAFRTILPASIEVTWPGARQIHVEVRPARRPASVVDVLPPPPAGERPTMSWTVSLSEPAPLRALNLLSAAMPSWTWRSDALMAPRELIAQRVLKMGRDLRLRTPTPSGHQAWLCPRRIAFVTASKAVLDGRDLGAPTRVAENPSVGPTRLASRPTFALGEGFFRQPGEGGMVQ